MFPLCKSRGTLICKLYLPIDCYLMRVSETKNPEYKYYKFEREVAKSKNFDAESNLSPDQKGDETELTSSLTPT